MVNAGGDTSCVLCACQEIVNFIFFLHTSTCCAESVSALQPNRWTPNRPHTKTSFSHTLHRIESLSSVPMSVCVGSLGSELYRYLCSKQTHTYAETYYNITKGAHFLLLSTKERRKKKYQAHRWCNFCVSCDYLFLISKATVWHVVAAQKYIILWQIATFNNKICSGRIEVAHGKPERRAEQTLTHTEWRKRTRKKRKATEKRPSEVVCSPI